MPKANSKNTPIYREEFFTAISNRICLLKHVIEGKIEGRIEVTGRQRRRSKQLPDDLKIKRA
jgi:hypothetical protein